jgi:hypothetical protein
LLPGEVRDVQIAVCSFACDRGDDFSSLALLSPAFVAPFLSSHGLHLSCPVGAGAGAGAGAGWGGMAASVSNPSPFTVVDRCT